MIIPLTSAGLVNNLSSGCSEAPAFPSPALLQWYKKEKKKKALEGKEYMPLATEEPLTPPLLDWRWGSGPSSLASLCSSPGPDLTWLVVIGAKLVE